MASKNDKTSKTARVMNLLSKKPDPAAEEATVEAPAAPAAAVPPIVTSMAPDAAVSVQIKSALEDALEVEAPRPSVPPAPAPVAEPEPEESLPLHQEVSMPRPGPMPEPAPAEEEAPVPQNLEEDAQKWKSIPYPIQSGYINVMQVLVEEKAPKYVELFGLCNCERCMEDVKALTLNHLPPKYVVLERGDMIPRLTVYEGKFTSDITAQLLQACKVVMERPHHGR